MAEQKDTFELDLDDLVMDGYDPLADVIMDEDDEIDFPIGDGGNLKASEGDRHVAPVPDVDPRPASERLAELMERMPTHRKTLVKVMEYCCEARPVREVSERIVELRALDHFVYSADDLTSLLERVGAIERIGEDGRPYVEEELEPRRVVIDGVEYLEPQTPAPAFWVATEAARDLLRARDPRAQVAQVLADEPIYLPIYKRILTLCRAAGGAKTTDIAKACDKDPLLLRPRMYSSRFVEKLNLAEALAWQGKTWAITDAGLEALADLDGIDDPASDVIAAKQLI